MMLGEFEVARMREYIRKWMVEFCHHVSKVGSGGQWFLDVIRFAKEWVLCVGAGA